MQLKLTTVATLLVASICFAAEQKIAVVNMQEIVAKSEIGKNAIAELNEFRLVKQKEVEAKDAELKALDKVPDGETPEAKTKREQEVAKLQRESRQASAENEKVIKDRSAQVMGIVRDKIMRAIRKVSKKQGFTVVLEAGQALDYDRTADITDDVVGEM